VRYVHPLIDTQRDPDYLNNNDSRFPGAPNYSLYSSVRPLYTLALRSTLSPNLVNELRGGVTALGGKSYFGNDASNGIETFAEQGGYALDFDANIGLTNWHQQNAPSWRSAPTFSIGNTLSWQRNSHSFSFGAEFVRATAEENAKQVVPGVNLGLDTTSDPAAGLFNATRFPGATAAQLNDARDLYALLTGRVISVTGQAALNPDTNKYQAFAPRSRAGRIDVYSAFAQDSWRVSPTLTLTGGLRWDVQLPFVAVNRLLFRVPEWALRWVSRDRARGALWGPGSGNGGGLPAGGVRGTDRPSPSTRPSSFQCTERAGRCDAAPRRASR